jgi:hypothetical protein
MLGGCGWTGLLELVVLAGLPLFLMLTECSSCAACQSIGDENLWGALRCDEWLLLLHLGP